jgi:hypothetical protein
MEVTCSSETSVDFQRTTLRYITEDRTLQYESSYVEVETLIITKLLIELK